MSPLESKLMDNLLDVYKSKGINVQRILENPIFSGLSLEDKVKFLEANSKAFSQKPSTGFKQALPNIGFGALTGIGAVGVAAALSSGVAPSVSRAALGVGAGWGALLGSIPSLMALSSGYKRDLATSTDIANNRILKALAARSIESTPAVPGVDVPGALKKTEEAGYKVIRENLA